MLAVGNKTALISGKQRISYTELCKKVALFAEQIKVEPKSRIMIFSENRIGYIYALYAIWYKKCCYSTWFFNLPAQNLANALEETNARFVFVSFSKLPLLRSAFEIMKREIDYVVIDDLEDLPADNYKPVELDCPDDEIAAVIYTAGITNVHKLTTMRFTAIRHNIYNLARSKMLTAEDNVLVLLPFYNFWILFSTIICPIFLRGSCVFSDTDDYEELTTIIRENNVSVAIIVKSIYDKMLEHFSYVVEHNLWLRSIAKLPFIKVKKLSQFLFSKFHKDFGSKFRYFLTVGTQIPEAIYKPLLCYGFDVYEGYGMAEAANLVTIPANKRYFTESVGKLMDDMEIRFINNEIVLKGPNILNEYQNSELNAEFLNNGWFFTGDLGYIDAKGHIHLLGRQTDEIEYSDNTRILPQKIEQAIEQYTDFIEECGCYLDDDNLKAIIRPKAEDINNLHHNETILTAEETIKWNVVYRYNSSVPDRMKIQSFTLTNKKLLRSTSGKLKRYTLKSYENRNDNTDR